MAERIPQSVAITVPLQAYLSTDHVSAATGKTIAITLSQNGGAYGNPSGGATNATEIGSGSYYVTLSTTDTGTLGPLFVKGTVAGVDTIIAIYNVVSATTLGASNLDAAVSSRMATYTQPTGFLAATFPSGTIANTTNITTATGITVSTNSDKTGYSLTQAFPTNFSALSITAAGLVSITSNRKKGSTCTIEFPGFDSTTGNVKTGLSFAFTISKDGGAPGATTNSPTEIGLGQYQLVLTATEMTANNIFLQGLATGGITYNERIQTQL